LLILRNEENFAEKTTISLTYAKLILVAFSFFLITMVASLYLSSTLMAQWFDPRHELIVMDRYLVDLANKTDSLENKIRIQEQFIHNMRLILIGEIGADESISRDSVGITGSYALKPIAAVDSQFRKNFEESELSFLVSGSTIAQEIEGQYFYSPISGIVTTEFNPKQEHFGIDIVSKQNEPVKAVADGTVIFADWTSDSGNVIAIQHRSNLISVYKHNSALMKKVGNIVSSGQVIAIIGNTGEFTTGPHLHFEMWYNGHPINPKEFVSF
jgi:murein DD-endopeptidase MepM/ murein hydrolase activator NlpD